MTGTPGVRVRGNDWGVLRAPELGAWTPRKPVSVVIPCHDADRTLPLALAALSVQSYPAHLLEVVVVDDGSRSPVTLPDLRPERCRVVTVRDDWGRANACRVGAEAADGEVVHWLDADMIVRHDEVEAQMRWHHEIDHAVVLGHKTFVDDTDLPDPGAVRAASRQRALEGLFADRWQESHAWVERIWDRSRDLRAAGFRAFHVHVGSTASVAADFYRESGGMDPDLKLGEDVELGYRLALRGGVFVGDRQACSWHLGRSTLMQREEQVQRYNGPFIADRVPDFRRLRTKRGRTYRVPLLEVVLDAEGRGYEEVKATVDAVLRSEPGDTRCVLLGRWSDLGPGRRRPLEDHLVDLRLIRAEYAAEARVALAEDLAPTPFPTPYRLLLPVGWRPGTALIDVPRDMQRQEQGLRLVRLADGHVARFESAAAFERALRVRRPGEALDDAVEQVSGSSWADGSDYGFAVVAAGGPPPG